MSTLPEINLDDLPTVDLDELAAMLAEFDLAAASEQLAAELADLADESR